jgi:type II secretory pathway component PulF
MVLYYLRQAVSLNLPIPPMLAAAEASEPGALGRRLRDVRKSIADGYAIGESLEDFVPELPARTVDMVAAGERIGRLPQVLDRLAVEEREAAREYTYGPMLGWNYGIVLVLFMSLALAGISVFIMPKFQEIFEDFGSVMPWQTILTFDLVGRAGAWLLPISIMVIVAVAGWALQQSLHGIEGARRPFTALFDRLVWMTPVARTVARDRGLGDACRIMAEALKAGDTLESAAFEAGNLKTNLLLRRRLQRFADALRSGRPMRDAAEEARLPRLMVGMLATAQAASDPVRVFDFLARYYANRFSRAATLARASVLPVTVLLMAVLTGWIVYSLMLPLVVLINVTNVQVGTF